MCTWLAIRVHKVLGANLQPPAQTLPHRPIPTPHSAPNMVNWDLMQKQNNHGQKKKQRKEDALPCRCVSALVRNRPECGQVALCRPLLSTQSPHSHLLSITAKGNLSLLRIKVRHRTASTLNSGLAGPWSLLRSESACGPGGKDWGSTCLPEVVFRSGRRVVLPTFTWLNCVCWRWSCSEFQLSPNRTSDKPQSSPRHPSTATAPSSLSVMLSVTQGSL